MLDEVGMKTTRPDAPGVDGGLFDDAVDNAPATAVENEEDSTSLSVEQAVGNEAEQAPKGSEGPEESADTEAENRAAEELKVVVSIKGGRAVIGVQRPSADPHIETFDDTALPGLAREVPAVAERARTRWEEAPKHPAYQRPALPAKRRSRRQQGTAQDSSASGVQTEQAQQQTLQLF